MKNLLLLNFKMMRNRILDLRFFDELKIAFFLFLSSGFILGIYFGSYRLLFYLDGVQMIGHLIVNKLLTMVFLSSFIMVIFSSFIASFNTIYFSRDLPWLLAMPLPVSKIFAHKALDTSFYASWMVFVMMFPFLLAYAEVKGAGPAFFFGMLALIVPFLLTAGLCGIVISMLMVRAFPARRVRDAVLVIGAFLLMGVFILFRFMEPEKLLRPEGMGTIAAYLSFLDAPTAAYLPSWWLSGAVFSLLGHNMKNFTLFASLLAGSAVLLFFAATLLAEKIFLFGWAQNQSGQGMSVKAPHKFASRRPFTALLIKDLKVFMRDTNQWSQLMFLGALSAVYLFSVYKVSLESMYLQNIIAFLNVGLIGFVVSAVALRFVFPSISIEGESFWIIKSSPITEERFLLEKALFGSIPVTALALLLSAVSGLLLKTDAAIFWVSVLASVIMAVGLNFMAVGFGAMFPRFNITNIAQIESSHGGLFFILAALFYIGANISLWAGPLRNYFMLKLSHSAAPWGSFVWVGAGIIALNLSAVMLPYKLGAASLKRLEI